MFSRYSGGSINNVPKVSSANKASNSLVNSRRVCNDLAFPVAAEETKNGAKSKHASKSPTKVCTSPNSAACNDSIPRVSSSNKILNPPVSSQKVHSDVDLMSSEAAKNDANNQKGSGSQSKVKSKHASKSPTKVCTSPDSAACNDSIPRVSSSNKILNPPVSSQKVRSDIELMSSETAKNGANNQKGSGSQSKVRISTYSDAYNEYVVHPANIDKMSLIEMEECESDWNSFNSDVDDAKAEPEVEFPLCVKRSSSLELVQLLDI